MIQNVPHDDEMDFEDEDLLIPHDADADDDCPLDKS